MNGHVHDYFDRTAAAFDAIHTEKHGLFGALIDRWFRPGMQERFNYIINRVIDHNRSVLDVGCGGGKYGVALARHGLAVTGIDFAPAMIELARGRAAQNGVAAHCRWLVGDIMHAQLEPSDAVLAIGVFDYVADPGPLLNRLKGLTANELIASFPRAGTWQGALRRLWLKTKKCPVFYYRPEHIAALTAVWDGTVEVVHSIRGDYLLHWKRS